MGNSKVIQKVKCKEAVSFTLPCQYEFDLQTLSQCPPPPAPQLTGTERPLGGCVPGVPPPSMVVNFAYHEAERFGEPLVLLSECTEPELPRVVSTLQRKPHSAEQHLLWWMLQVQFGLKQPGQL